MSDTLAWPIHIDESGEYAVVEVGSDQEAVQNIVVLSQTRLAERIVVPEYGTPDPVGLRGLDPQPLIDAAARWCPGRVVTATAQPGHVRVVDQIVEVQ